MDKIVIQGGQPLSGRVRVSGAKNAALPIMAAALLTDEPCRLHNMPLLRDVSMMDALLSCLGRSVRCSENTLDIVKVATDISVEAPYDVVRKMRASICVLGPLLATYKKARAALPGGRVIGPRPVELHLNALSALGASIHVRHGFIEAEAQILVGADIVLNGPFGSTVLGTANTMMAASLAQGLTRIQCAACEPEIVDLANFLNAMGANISGAGTATIEIEGVSRLHGVEYTVIPDRIEAATYLVAGAITRGNVWVENAQESHMEVVLQVLRQMGYAVDIQGETIGIDGDIVPEDPVSVTTAAFPGFPTDMQAQLMALLCFVKGVSIIKEGVYPDRFMHIGELNRMGAKVTFESGFALVEGVNMLSGAAVMASDLRASAALILAGLAACGTTEILRVYHIDRGYAHMVAKLKALGATIYREHTEGP